MTGGNSYSFQGLTRTVDSSYDMFAGLADVQVNTINGSLIFAVDPDDNKIRSFTYPNSKFEETDLFVLCFIRYKFASTISIKIEK